jgi:hypothetical protein
VFTLSPSQLCFDLTLSLINMVRQGSARSMAAANLAISPLLRSLMDSHSRIAAAQRRAVTAMAQRSPSCRSTPGLEAWQQRLERMDWKTQTAFWPAAVSSLGRCCCNTS